LVQAAQDPRRLPFFQTTSSERITKYDPNLYKKPEIEEMRQLDNAISNGNVKGDFQRLIGETLTENASAYFELKRPRGAQSFPTAKLD
jgi:hypothetical protein